MLRQQLSVSCSNNRKITHLWPFIKRHILCWFTGVGLLRCIFFLLLDPKKRKIKFLFFFFFGVLSLIFFIGLGPFAKERKKFFLCPDANFVFFFSLCPHAIFFLSVPACESFFLCPEVFLFRALLVQHLASHASNGGEIWWGHHGTNVSMVWITKQYIYIYPCIYIYNIYIYTYVFVRTYVFIYM